MSNITDRLKKRLAEQQAKKQKGYWTPPKSSPGEQNWSSVHLVQPRYMDPDDEPFVEFSEYAISLGEKKTYYGCAPSFFNLPDPIADHYDELMNRGQKRKAGPFRAKQRFAVFVYVAGLERLGPLIWKFGITVWEQIARLVLKPANKGKRPWRLDEGYALDVLREGEGIDTTYTVTVGDPDAEFEGLEEAFAKASTMDLRRRVLRVDTPETLEGVLDGEYDWKEAAEARKERDDTEGLPFKPFLEFDSEDDEDDEEEEEAPRRRKGAAKREQAKKPQARGSKSARMPDPDEDGDAGEGEEEEPRQSGRKTQPVANPVKSRKPAPPPEEPKEPEDELPPILHPSLKAGDVVLVPVVDEEGAKTGDTEEAVLVSREVDDEGYATVQVGKGKNAENVLVAADDVLPMPAEAPAPKGKAARKAAPAAPKAAAKSAKGAQKAAGDAEAVMEELRSKYSDEGGGE